MAENIRTYICTGCGIDQCLNTGKLAQVSEAETGSPARVHAPLCVPEGIDFLRNDLQAGGADQAIIVACSHRVNWDVFSPESLGVKMVERVNIREHVAWSKPPNDEETQFLAEDYTRMGIARAQRSKPPPARVEPTERSLLVVGGGITGMTAALEAAAAATDVILVERSESLGGWLTRFHQMYPSRAPYRELTPQNVNETVQRVRDHPNIKVFTQAEVQSISGHPGNFDVILRHNGQHIPLRAGAIVQATGWEPYDPSHLEYLGYGKYPNVVNSLAMEDMARQGSITRPSDGKQVQSVAFIQRVGSRTDDLYAYGSSVSDLVALKQAEYVRQLYPEAVSYIIYDNMITLGQMEMFYVKVQEDDRIFFTKAQVAQINGGPQGSLLIDLEDTLIGGNLRLQVDLVVLATGMAPTSAGTETLHLEYRQGAGLPVDQHGFANSNFICFPYETRRTGIYAAGCVREPMDATAAAEDATGAALKAIQSLELIASGASVHPRVRDLSLPITNLQGCTQCGRCSEECPFGAIEVDEQRNPRLNSSRCRRCGICMGSCPVQVISFEDYNVEQLSSMVRAVEFPEDENTPRIIAFACENDAHPAFDMAGINRLAYDASIRVIPLRCLGSLNIVLIIDALSRGIDGVMLLGCKTGDNYQCHFIHGSELASKRLANIQETLTRQMLEPERVQFLELEISDFHRIPDLVNSFVEQMKAIGPNPYKGL